MPGAAAATSLRFFGNGVDDIDRVKIRIDGPARPADVGAGDFTLEWWMRALPGDNSSDAVACGSAGGWIFGNILFDRDIFDVPGEGATHGDFGVSLSGGRIAFGVSAGLSGNTACGVTDVRDDAWHHVAVTRQRSDGRLRIYVDGVLDGEAEGGVGPNRDVSYQDGRDTEYPADPFLVIGAEKHDAGPEFPSYSGWIDEVRLSTVQRYTDTTFTRPFAPFALDGSTAALYHMDEGAGTTVGDAAVGGSHGTLMVGGTPSGPEWSGIAAPLDTARRITLETVVASVPRPVAIAHAGDDRLFVVDANGQILAYRVPEDGHGPLTPLGTFLDIRGRVECCGERGLLGLAFHPDYATNGYFFVFYTAKAAPGLALGDIVVAAYRNPSPAGNVADPASVSTLLTIPHSSAGNHNGGALAFGPDGHLYVAVGDGGGGGDPLNSGQRKDTLLGKVLRLAIVLPDAVENPVSYAIPLDNPFVDEAGARPEIWAWGLRNPWRIAFDRVTGDLFIADVGQGEREEVNFQRFDSPGGENYGWRRMEGTICHNPGAGCQTGELVLPIIDYSHGEGCSVTGGYRYRGTRIPTLHGGYLFADFCQGTIWVGAQAGSGVIWTKTLLIDTSLSISTFGEDVFGELYVADLGGAVYRIAPLRPRLTVTRAGAGTGTVGGPGGIDCGGACSAVFDPGETVVLTAVAGGSSFFAGWSGACGGTGTCTVSMDSDRSVTATFATRPVFQFGAAGYSVNEGAGGATITVQRLQTTAGSATVDYAIHPGSATAPPASDADFGGPGGALTGTLTFMPGQASRTLTIPVVNDTRVEGPESILLSLHEPSPGALLGTQRTAVVTIVDNDSAGVLQFASATQSVSESAGSATVIVQRLGGQAGASATWTVTGGTAVLGVDFTTPNGLSTGIVTFPGNAASVPIPLTLLRQGDTLADGPRTIQLGLSLPQPAGFATVGANATTLVTVADNDSAGSLQLGPTSLTVSEAGGPAVLTVTRNQAAGGVSVSWAVVTGAGGGTAVAGTDFTGPTGGTLPFGPGVLSQTITIPIVDRVGAQGSRTLVVQLSAPGGGAALGPARTATVTIADDEVGLQFAQAGYAATELNGAATITVVRTGPTNAPVSVAYTTGPPSAGVPAAATGAATCQPGADYRTVSGTLAFAAGQTSKSFAVPLCRDGVVDGPVKTVGLALSAPGPAGMAHLGPRATADLTIQNVDAGGVLRWTVATASITEATPSVTLTAMRTGGSAGGVSVDYVIAGTGASASEDVTGPLTGVLDFGPNVTFRSLTIPIANDTAAEPNETFTVTLQNPQGGATVGSPNVATVTIVDNDRTGTVQLTQATVTVAETSPSVTLMVTRTGAIGAPAAVQYEITGDTDAVDPADLAGTVTFLANQASRSLVIRLANDTIADGDATFRVALLPPSGGLTLGAPSFADVRVVDDEGTVQFAAAAYTVSEASFTASIALTRTGSTAQAVSVSYAIGDAADTTTPAATPGACSAGADYRPIPGGTGTLTFFPGQTTSSFSVPLCGDGVVETPDPEMLTLRLLGVSAPASLGAQTTAVLRIQENDAAGALRFTSAAYSVGEGAGTASLTVTRPPGGAGNVTVDWTLTDLTAIHGVDYQGPQSGTLTFGPGQITASLPVAIRNDALADGPRTLLAELSGPTGGAVLGAPASATLTIADDEPTVRLQSAAITAPEDGTTASVTLVLSRPASQVVEVTLATGAAGTAEAGACGAAADFVALESQVVFQPGQMFRTVPITLCPDSQADGPETIALALTNPVGATLGTPNTGIVQLTDNDVAGSLQFAVSTLSVSEDQGIATLLVTRTGGQASQVAVDWAVTGGTAMPDADYTGPTAGQLVFGASQTSQPVEIPIVDRVGLQGPRSIAMTLTPAAGGGTLGAQKTATVWILDAD